MKSVSMPGFLIALVLLPLAPASAERLGEHPAISQARAHASAGYDYASKFYPHPAWLYLLPKQPDAEPAPVAEVIARPQTRTVPIEEGAKQSRPSATASVGVIGRPWMSTGPIDQPAIFFRPFRSDRRGALR